MKYAWICMWLFISTWASSVATAQSSSLFIEQSAPTGASGSGSPMVVNGVVNRLSPAIAQNSFIAARMADNRKFAVHDLVSIVVSEATQAGSDASLNTNKETKIDDKVSAFPNLRLDQLIRGRITGGPTKDLPEVSLDAKNDFKGSGQYGRKDTFTSRLTAEVIDVKPNGTIVLEARKFIKTDDETMNMIITGTCRAEDVTIDNTVMSSQLHDLSIVKENTGELRNASKKGLFTTVLDFVFNF